MFKSIRILGNQGIQGSKESIWPMKTLDSAQRIKDQRGAMITSKYLGQPVILTDWHWVGVYVAIGLIMVTVLVKFGSV